MENQNYQIIDQSSPPSPPSSPRKTGFKLFAIGFAVIVIAIGGGWYAWDGYLSPSARYAREMKANYQKYLDWEKEYQQTLKDDTHGGKTPEETLAMFIEALKDGDVELASKYFFISNDLKIDGWKNFLTRIEDEGNLLRFAQDIEKHAKPGNILDKKSYGFVLYNDDGTVGLQINMKFNEYSEIWKIESL